LFRYTRNGQARQMGLGPADLVTLAEARLAATECRKQMLHGTDPLEARKTQRTKVAAEAAAEVARGMTFRACAEAYIEKHQAGWRNDKHAAQWGSTLAAYVYPKIGALPVAAIDTGLVTQILDPIWTTKPETASRVRGRIEAILDYAATLGWRSTENPARWKGHLQNILPARGKIAKVRHHAALPWRDVGAFMAQLQDQSGVSALALSFAVLTAARTGEVIGARWREFDISSPRTRTIPGGKDGETITVTEGAVWTVPADRMKARQEHRVPLSQDVLALLHHLAQLRDAAAGGDAFVFPGAAPGRGLSNMAMLALLRRMGGGLTAHGFRSTFRDWAAETAQPADIAEAALAHVVGDKTVAAYQRGDLLERRRKLMAAWAAFCARPAPAAGEVIALRRA
jgi:integrase